MYRERINEEKKRLGITAKSMSERSKLRLPDETISRVLSGKTADPGISTVLDIGDTVGLAPYEIFMDSTMAAEFKVYLELKSKNDETEAERIRILAENELLKSTNLSLASENDKLKMEIAYKDRLLESKDETLKLYRILSEKEKYD